ncbi:MAG TPA: alpha/beta fold hydrolase [Myxococcota bacterium]
MTFVQRAVVHVTAADGVALDLHRSKNHDVHDDAPAIIMCHGFVQNALAFESESRSLLAFLRGLGFVVYAIELRGRSHTAAAHGLFEYVDVDAVAAIDAVAALHRSVSFIGHSMGGLVATMLPAESSKKLAAVVTIGAPLFAGPASLRRIVSPDRAIAAARFAHGRGLRFEGRRWSGALYALRRVLDQPRVPMPLRIWAPGSLDERALAFTLKQSFSNDSWAVFADLLHLIVTDGEHAGSLAAGERIRRFDRPLLVVAGEHDDLAPPTGARPLFHRAGTRDKEYLEVGAAHGVRAGHIDLLIGDAAPALVWQPIARFLATRGR